MSKDHAATQDGATTTVSGQPQTVVDGILPVPAVAAPDPQETLDIPAFLRKWPDDPQEGASEEIAMEKPTITELEWMGAAPPGYFETTMLPNGEVRATLGPKLRQALRSRSGVVAVREATIQECARECDRYGSGYLAEQILALGQINTVGQVPEYLEGVTLPREDIPSAAAPDPQEGEEKT